VVVRLEAAGVAAAAADGSLFLPAPAKRRSQTSCNLLLSLTNKLMGVK